MVSPPWDYFKPSLSKPNQAFSLQITPLPSVSPLCESFLQKRCLFAGRLDPVTHERPSGPPSPKKTQSANHMARHGARYWVYEIKEQSQSRSSCSGHYQATLYHKSILTSPSILKSPPGKQTSKITSRLYPETLYHLTLTYFSRLISKFTLSTPLCLPQPVHSGFRTTLSLLSYSPWATGCTLRLLPMPL